jgi:hypothetical protein
MSSPKTELKNFEYLIYKALYPIKDMESLIHKLGQSTKIVFNIEILLRMLTVIL